MREHQQPAVTSRFSKKSAKISVSALNESNHSSCNLNFLVRQKTQYLLKQHITLVSTHPLLSWWFLDLTLVNQALTPETPALMPPVVQLISLYTGLCNGKMPWGHVSLSSFQSPSLTQQARPSPPPLPPPHIQPSPFYFTSIPTLLCPYLLFGALRVHRQPQPVLVLSQSGSRG